MTVCAEALEELMALGVDGPALVAAIRRLEQAAYGDRIASLEATIAESTTRADAAFLARKAKERDRKRAQRGQMSRDVPVCPRDSVGQGGTKDVSPTPPSENPSPPKRTLKGPKKVPLPNDPHQPEKPNSEIAKPLSEWVGEIWEITPPRARGRSGRHDLETALKAAERRGDDLSKIKLGVAGYFASDDATHEGGKFAKGVHIVVSSGRWESFAEDEPAEAPDPDPWPRRLLGWRTNAYWNSEWGPKPGKDGYVGPPAEGLAA